MSGMEETSRGQIFTPHPRQELVMLCPINEILYGGSAGSGKSFCIIFSWLQHEATYGWKAKGLVLRKTNPELEDLVQEFKKVFSALPNPPKWNETKRTFTHHSGSVLEMGYLDSDDDKYRYHGRQFCVAGGTKIVMWDDGLKKIEDIYCGDFVMTMEGPKEVLGVHKIGRKSCVYADVWHGTSYLGRQIHPESHPILQAQPLQIADSIQTSPRFFEGCATWSSWKSVHDEYQGIQENCASLSCRDGAGTAIHSLHQGSSQPEQWNVPVVLHKPTLQRSPYGKPKPTRHPQPGKSLQPLEAIWIRHYPTNDPDHPQPPRPPSQQQDRTSWPSEDDGSVGVSFYSGTEEDFQSYYHPSPRLCDGPPQHLLDTDQGAAPSQVCAPLHTPLLLPLGDLEREGKHIPSEFFSYLHPYSNEIQSFSEESSVGWSCMAPYGEEEVYDLTVADTNHYISETGLVNRNTFLAWDELTLWETPEAYDFLRTRVRSAHGVPVTILSTTNPIGVGANWVMDRWQIDRHPDGMKPIRLYMSTKTGEIWDHKPDWDGLSEDVLPPGIKRWSRIFIPGKLADNPSLDEDGSYRSQLMMQPDKIRKALLEGRWDAIEGAFFDEWMPQVHVVKGFIPPKGGRKWMALDWGTAKPYCALWGWDSPSGELFIYDELYGWGGAPDKGTMEPASLVAQKIRERELDRNEYIVERYMDPSCFSKDGHEVSIADIFRQAQLHFLPGPRRNKEGRIALLREKLKVVNGNAQLKVCDNCNHLIRTLPRLQFDKTNPQVYDSRSEDHAVDALLYLIIRNRTDIGAVKLNMGEINTRRLSRMAI